MVSADFDLRTAPPEGEPRGVQVDTVQRLAFDACLGGPPSACVNLLSVGAPLGVSVDQVPTQVIERSFVGPVQEGISNCLAGAIARSLCWLGWVHGFDSRPSPQQMYTNLLPFYGPPRSYEGFLTNKQSYLQQLARPSVGVTKILDLSNVLEPMDGTGTSAVEAASTIGGSGPSFPSPCSMRPFWRTGVRR